MKKHFFFTPLLAVLMAMTTISCQKEESIVTLGAKIQKPVSGNAKVYIDDHTPCWHNGDEVYINNAAYPIMAASGSSARIENVVSSNTYRAIFPASIVTEGSNIGSNASFPVTLPSTQTYQVLDGVQRVDVPMGAYLTSGSTLQFQNLCSVVRVTVSNSLTTALSLQSIVIDAENAYLSGAGTATVSGSSSDGITISSNSSHSVSLAFPTYNPVMVGALRSADFDIIVPAFTTDNVTITINTTDGQHFTISKHNQLSINTITTVTVNVTELTGGIYAELVNGRTFRSAIPHNATSVVFEYNSAINTGYLLSTPTSPVPIYGNLDGMVWRVSTSAVGINAHPDCSFMFINGDYATQILHNTLHSLSNIYFGEGFSTTNVTNMRSMFANCDYITSLDLSIFNTSNVTNMLGIFDGCSSLISLDLSNFNTSNVTNMQGMFADCNSLTNLNLSSFNTSNVTNMSYMFLNCSELSDLNLSSFNTSNVTRIIYMFDLCSNLTSLDLSNFDMTNITEKYGMCHDLSTSSGHCTITCPYSVETALRSGTNLPTSGVTFTWVRP